MDKQAIVIGLGQFGMTLARALTEQGVEVVAVDLQPSLVQEASGFTELALVLDGTDETALAGLAPSRRDICVVAIGNESREGSIIATALLRQLGASRIVARATDPLLERILALVGAHEVVNPERAFGERFARRLVHRGIVDEIRLGRDLVVSEIRTRPSMIGRSLAELALPRRFGLTVLGIRTEVGGVDSVIQPDPHRPLVHDDILLVAGAPSATEAIVERE